MEEQKIVTSLDLNDTLNDTVKNDNTTTVNTNTNESNTSKLIFQNQCCPSSEVEINSVQESDHNIAQESNIPHERQFEDSMKEEFMFRIKSQFLSGRDPHTDYAAIDLNEAYDDFSKMERDAADRYFDE